MNDQPTKRKRKKKYQKTRCVPHLKNVRLRKHTQTQTQEMKNRIK